MRNTLQGWRADDEKENVDAKGKAPMPEEDIGEEEPVLDDGDEDEDAEEGDEGDSDDMKLAWEMLEVARTICPKDKPLQLAGDALLLANVTAATAVLIVDGCARKHDQGPWPLGPASERSPSNKLNRSSAHHMKPGRGLCALD